MGSLLFCRRTVEGGSGNSQSHSGRARRGAQCPSTGHPYQTSRKPSGRRGWRWRHKGASRRNHDRYDIAATQRCLPWRFPAETRQCSNDQACIRGFLRLKLRPPFSRSLTRGCERRPTVSLPAGAGRRSGVCKATSQCLLASLRTSVDRKGPKTREGATVLRSTAARSYSLRMPPVIGTIGLVPST